MSAIKRKRLPKYLVLVDANVLWHDDKTVVVCPQFEAFWSNHAIQFELELVLPDVVIGELVYQQTMSALKILEKTNADFTKLGAIAGKRYRHRLTEAQVRADVNSRFSSWLSSHSALIEATPYTAIDWPAIVDAAVWRHEPFTADPKNPEIEKGFRDAMILETVVAVAARKATHAHVAFVCKDGLLRKTAQRRFGQVDRAACYESLEHFSSQLRLSREKLTEEFVRAIQVRAATRFFGRNADGLWSRESVEQKIHEKFSDEFGSPTDPPFNLVFGTNIVFGGTNTLGGSFATWEPAAPERWWIFMPLFLELRGEREFHWATPVTFAQSFHTGVTFAPRESRIRTLAFRVKWKASVSQDGRFHSPEVTDLEFSERRFVASTDKEVERYAQLLVDTSPTVDF